MKKAIFFLAAFAAVAIVACSSKDPDGILGGSGSGSGSSGSDSSSNSSCYCYVTGMPETAADYSASANALNQSCSEYEKTLESASGEWTCEER